MSDCADDDGDEWAPPPALSARQRAAQHRRDKAWLRKHYGITDVAGTVSAAGEITVTITREVACA